MKIHSPLATRRGFSLVELSIVLVILGLLVGGVLSGQSLIRAAELRSTIADYTRYTTAVQSFRDKYFALPGDMTNATAFWGVRAGTGSDVTCHQTINTTTGTCNGNGDGRIDFIAGDSATLGERFAAWQHLARAGLIEGSYTGASASASAYVQSPGITDPKGKIANSFFTFGHIYGPVSGDTNVYDGSYNKNFISVVSNGAPSLKPEEAWNIDTKLDDGRPSTGAAFTWKSTSVWLPGCTTTDVVATAAYALTSSGKLCNISLNVN